MNDNLLKSYDAIWRHCTFRIAPPEVLGHCRLGQTLGGQNMKVTFAKFASLSSALVVVAFVGTAAQAQQASTPVDVPAVNVENVPFYEDVNDMDELDPFDPNIEEKLNMMDEVYEQETGIPAHLPDTSGRFQSTCYQATCSVWAHVNKAKQLMSLYENGQLIGQFATSTGTPGHGTPNFDQRPNGRIYDRYTSTKYPGGDYNGLGNMPYAVFIKGGFAIHGTGKSNWPKLGRVASHGCIRIHPDNAYRFNRLVRQYGVANSWITVN